MKTVWLAVCLAVASGTIGTAREPVSGTIGLAPGSNVSFSANQTSMYCGVLYACEPQRVSFTWTTQHVADLGKKDGPRIQVLCYQDGALVYGMADRADASFLLGGGSSQWVLNGGGPAHCTADLYFWSYRGSQEFNLLATMEFDATE